jgi:hypothetical protein
MWKIFFLHVRVSVRCQKRRKSTGMLSVVGYNLGKAGYNPGKNTSITNYRQSTPP